MNQNATTQLLHSDIYPALFHVLPQALPEFEFVRTRAGYRSTNTRKVTGEEGDSKGKVFVYEDSPGYLKDWRGDRVSIWDYVQQQQGLPDASSVVRRLAELAELSLPEQAYSPDQVERFKKLQRISDAWESANGFFIDCLSREGNIFANMPGARRVRDYLTLPLSQGGRGYNPATFRLSGQAVDRDTPRMELGFIPSLPELIYHLQDAGFDPDEVNELMTRIGKAGPAVGRENILTFPYRDHTGRIQGMTFRTVDKAGQSKYLYSDFKRGDILFNLRSVAGDRDLVVVESPLDAMHAAALGIKNITALGGSGNSMNRKQIDLAIRFGAKKITLMLDNDSEDGVDRAGAKGTDSAIAFLQKDYPDLRVFVASYPEGIKDLDELLTTYGVEDGYLPVVGNAVPAWNYQLDRIFTRYAALAGEGDLTHKQVDALLEEVQQTAARLTVLDKDIFIQSFKNDPGVQSLGITEQSLQQAVDKIRKADFDREQQTRLQTLLKDAGAEGAAGRTSEALSLLTKRGAEIKGLDKVDTFAGLNRPLTLQALRDAWQHHAEALDSGYVIDKEPLLIPSAAITFVAGATSHGKSVLLANLLLNLASKYPGKTFHLFSYEVTQERYMVNLLNTYIGDNDLAYNNRESLEHLLRGKDKIVRHERTYPLFRPGKDGVVTTWMSAFFGLIETGRIKVHYVNYDSDMLNEAIRHIARTESVGAILVDYVQLISMPTGKLRNPSRQEELKQMSIDFKDVAIETKLPLIFGAQFNREVTNLANMHATKLGEAGDLERIADLILGIWNLGRKPHGTPKQAEQTTIKDRVGGEEPNPDAWYVEVLKRRGGRVESWDIWDYKPNAAKVISNSAISF